MKHTRFLGILSVVGGVSAVPLFIAFAAIGWSVPGTAAYARYELLNRITAVSLLLMLAGWVGLAVLLIAALPLTVIVSMVSPFMGPAVLTSALGWVLLNGRQSSIT